MKHITQQIVSLWVITLAALALLYFISVCITLTFNPIEWPVPCRLIYSVAASLAILIGVADTTSKL